MTKAKLYEVRDAFKGFAGVELEDRTMRGGIGNEKLPAKAAWRVGRMIGKLKSELRDFEETQRKLFRDAGAEQSGSNLQMPALERKPEETDEAWGARIEARRKALNEVNEKVEELLNEEVEIDYEPISLSLFENEKEVSRLTPNDIMLVGPFLKE